MPMVVPSTSKEVTKLIKSHFLGPNEDGRDALLLVNIRGVPMIANTDSKKNLRPLFLDSDDIGWTTDFWLYGW